MRLIDSVPFILADLGVRCGILVSGPRRAVTRGEGITMQGSVEALGEVTSSREGAPSQAAWSRMPLRSSMDLNSCLLTAFA